MTSYLHDLIIFDHFLLRQITQPLPRFDQVLKTKSYRKSATLLCDTRPYLRYFKFKLAIMLYMNFDNFEYEHSEY